MLKLKFVLKLLTLKKLRFKQLLLTNFNYNNKKY